MDLNYKHRKYARATARVFNKNYSGRRYIHKYALRKYMKLDSLNNRHHEFSVIVNNGSINLAVLGYVALGENTQSLTKLLQASASEFRPVRHFPDKNVSE